MGAATGAAAVYSGNRKASFEEVATGAGIGLGIGLITSYFTHKQVEQKREQNPPETNMYFGDLPPSPFVTPNLKKRGN